MSTDRRVQTAGNAGENSASGGTHEPLEMVVYAGSVIAVHPLPRSGRVTLGRSASNDVFIDDPSVSRQHAVLHLGATLSIEDLGSANGTRMRDSAKTAETLDLGDMRLQPGQRAEVPLCSTVNLGSTTIVVRPAETRAGTGAATPSGASRGGWNAGSDSGVIVQDDAMRKLYALAERVAEGPISVLLLGETGVGKEVLAETIHRRSPRANGPFLRLNCAALSESLLESELFGHEKGAFTGAIQAKPGLFETANGGTVFLDEAGELPMSIQIKLLRVLEERKVLRVGGLKPRDIDVRFISATNRDLLTDVERGSFRQDLYFRLNGISLTIPPLRERLGEIEALATVFANRAGHQMGRAAPPRISPDALARMRAYPWPGNVRELRNVVERAVVLSGGEPITPEHLVLERARVAEPPLRSAPSAPARRETAEVTRATLAPPPDPGLDPAPPMRLWSEMDALERERIIDALEKCAGNQTQAALLLGISRRTLVARLGDYGIPRPRKR